ncbi:MAG: hypothetical protein KAR17_19610, partial [Cyclobacteriaceae bacterium]|nr:hypothetical protein [Cyclobacteriaceae bacterium]
MLIRSLGMQVWSDSINGIFNQMRLPLLMAAMLILLTSCYSDYVHLDYDVHHHAVWNDGHNKIAFVCSKHAYIKATGIAAFPDGGQSKVLLESIGLYLFDTTTNKLTQLVDFTDLTEVPGTYRTNWDNKLVFNNSKIYYSITPS